MLNLCQECGEPLRALIPLGQIHPEGYEDRPSVIGHAFIPMD